jgi:putative NIF3 family GTP cyclohydrolase 1 type 2
MKVKELFEFVLEEGVRADPRGREVIEENMKFVRTTYDKLPQEEKDIFDVEKLTNPYPDSRILYGDGEKDVHTVLIGIDIEAPEILLAYNLLKDGKRVDLVIAHHPEGKALASLYEVMYMQNFIFSKFGVSINVAEKIMQPRIREVERKLLPQNHTRAVDMCKLLDIPFMCIHTPADNQVVTYLQGIFDREKPSRLGDVYELLMKQPEYKKAVLYNQGPKILSGSKESYAGRIFIDMTGGTEGSPEILEKLSQAGIGTIIGMHFSEEHFKNAEKCYLNLIVAGHIPSDTLGLNLLLDKVERAFGELEIICCSGFERFRRM